MIVTFNSDPEISDVSNPEVAGFTAYRPQSGWLILARPFKAGFE
jgi:hypothetical protein